MKKISHDEFVAGLARELKADAVIIDSRLQDFLESLQSSLNDEGKVSIEGLGDFLLDDGRILFEPDETLALEVNYKYAGMEPIEIMPAYAKKLKEENQDEASSDQTKAPLTPVHPSEKEAGAGKENKKEKQESKPSSTEPKQPNMVDDEDPFNLADAHSKTTSEPSGDAKTSEEPAAKPEELEKSPKGTVGNTGAKKAATAAEEKGATDDSEDSPRSKVTFYLVAAVAALLLVSLYIYQNGDLPFNLPGSTSSGVITTRGAEDSEQPASANHELRQGDSPVASAIVEEDEEIAEPEPMNTESTEDSEPDIPSATVSSEAGDSAYGLHGNLTEVNRPFTIVVHSLPYRQASIERDKLGQAGYRATLTSFIKDNGNETWRVGLGQFATIEDASNAIQRLEEPYKSNNFISKIRN